MEILNENHIPQGNHRGSSNCCKDPKRCGNIYLGVMLIATGLLWLFHNIGFIGSGVFNIIFSWEVLMIVLGGYMLAIRRYTMGAIIGGVGLLFLITSAFNIHISFSKVVLPIIIIAIGISLIVSRSTNCRY